MVLANSRKYPSPMRGAISGEDQDRAEDAAVLPRRLLKSHALTESSELETGVAKQFLRVAVGSMHPHQRRGKPLETFLPFSAVVSSLRITASASTTGEVDSPTLPFPTTGQPQFIEEQPLRCPRHNGVSQPLGGDLFSMLGVETECVKRKDMRKAKPVHEVKLWLRYVDERLLAGVVVDYDLVGIAVRSWDELAEPCQTIAGSDDLALRIACPQDPGLVQ